VEVEVVEMVAEEKEEVVEEKVVVVGEEMKWSIVEWKKTLFPLWNRPVQQTEAFQKFQQQYCKQNERILPLLFCKQC
jgi:hypothetical protein